MKYWRGYLIAGFLAIATWALAQFAAGHIQLMDMVYPYMIRMLLPEVTLWSSGVDFCLWQVLLLVVIAGIVASIVLMFVLRWNPIQWFGWVLAVTCLFTFLNTGIFGLGNYTAPLAEDILLNVEDYSFETLEQAATFYRDKANVLSRKVNRDENNQVIFASFEDLSQQAGAGFRYLTYERGFSVLSGDISPVKKLGWENLYSSRGITGMTVYLTGESAVNPQTPQVALPFVICREMAKRMSVFHESDANFAAFLASTCHEGLPVEFQYSAYLMAYRIMYNTISAMDDPQAVILANDLQSGSSNLLLGDIAAYDAFLPGSQATAADQQFTDLLVSWYIQEVIIPSNAVDEDTFDPMDETDDRLQDIVKKKA